MERHLDVALRKGTKSGVVDETGQYLMGANDRHLIWYLIKLVLPLSLSRAGG